MKRLIRIAISLLLVFSLNFSSAISSYAHSGRTDSSGGHKDNKNKSGLGSYHYHCGGFIGLLGWYTLWRRWSTSGGRYWYTSTGGHDMSLMESLKIIYSRNNSCVRAYRTSLAIGASLRNRQPFVTARTTPPIQLI